MTPNCRDRQTGTIWFLKPLDCSCSVSTGLISSDETEMGRKSRDELATKIYICILFNLITSYFFLPSDINIYPPHHHHHHHYAACLSIKASNFSCLFSSFVATLAPAPCTPWNFTNFTHFLMNPIKPQS